MAKKTAAGLVQWAEDAYKNGWVYWYGTCGYQCTTSLLNSKARQYPDHYGDDRMATYKKHIAAGKVASDCIGLFKSYAWDKDEDIETVGGAYGSNGHPDYGARQALAKCKVKGGIATMPEIPGLAVWTKTGGHIGVYVGGGRVVELRGFAYGSKRPKLEDRSFVTWGLYPFVEYTPEQVAIAEKAAGATVKADGTRPTLRKGDMGAAVKELQELLLAAGCTLPNYGADGSYGTETVKAVKAYQTANSLTPDGICGPLTWAKLDTIKDSTSGSTTTAPIITTTRPTLRKGDKGPDVKEMQQMLLDAGCTLPKYGADGSYGAETVKAVKAYQTTHALHPDGICGPLTWAALEG